jgi:hypothetical protein
MAGKRILTLMSASILALALVGCGSNKTVVASVNPDRLNTNYANALPVESQLILGTLKLEGTPQAVDTATAAKLIPLYTLLQQMTTSGTSAQVEIDAVLDQIQGTMTADQIHAIAAMKLTQTDMVNYFSSAGGFQRSGTRTPNARSNGGGGFPGGGGGFPGGGEGVPPGGGFVGGGGGSSLNQNQIATLQAQRTGSPGARGSGTPAFLITQLLQVLQKKTESLTPAGNQSPTENFTPTENLTPPNTTTPTP